MILIQFLKYILDPPFSGISEYSIEQKEWIMVFVFFVWVTSYAYLLMSSLRFRIKSLKGKISLALLVISSIGLIIAGILNISTTVPDKIDSRQINKPLKPEPHERHIRYR